MPPEALTKKADSEIEEIDVVEIIRARLEKEFKWTVIEEYPESMVLGPNMREKSEGMVEELVKSMSLIGQMQECNGDTLEDGTVRVIAGQHRFWAVESINNSIDEHNSENPEDTVEHMRLRVRVAERELSAYEMLDLQIAENLHKDLRPEEEAETISDLFFFYREVIGEKEATVSDFSKRVSRGETKVRNALKFMRLDERVREMVEEDVMLYYVATKLARLPSEKQFNVAMKITLYNLLGGQVDVLIKSTLGEEEVPGLFTEEMHAEIEAGNYRLALRNAADRAAKDASGYFKRVLYILSLVDEPERVTMTDTIRDILTEFVISADEFRDELETKTPHLWEILKARIGELLSEAKRKTG